MSVTFISYRPGDADYTTHTLHPLEGATQSGQTQVVELISIGGVTYAMVIDANTSSTNGLNGWTPVLATHVDGDRTLLRVSDWTGGGGTKPATGLFIGASGFVADMAQAVSVRGAKGDAGDLAALADGSIAKVKLSVGVQASLGKADQALPSTAGAIADVLEAAPTADPSALARIQYAVSGDRIAALTPIARFNRGTKGGNMGDSHTFGVGSTNAGVYAYQAVYRQSLGGMVASSASINAGVSGTDTANMLSRLPALLDQGISFLTILGGTNDALGNVPVTTYKANISAMIEMALGKGVPVYLISPPPMYSTQPAAQHKLVESYRHTCILLAQKYGIPYVPAWESLVDPLTGYMHVDYKYSADDLHLNNRGHAQVGMALANAIRPTLRFVPRPVSSKNRHNTLTNPIVSGTVGQTTLPSGFAVNGTPTGTLPTYSVVAKSGLLEYGNWLQVEYSAPATDSYIEININPNINPTVGDQLAACYTYEIDGVSAPWQVLSAAGADAVLNLVVGASYAGGSSVGLVDRGMVSYRAASTAAAAYAIQRLRITCKAGQSFRVRIGELGVLNETTMGMTFDGS